MLGKPRYFPGYLNKAERNGKVRIDCAVCVQCTCYDDQSLTDSFLDVVSCPEFESSLNCVRISLGYSNITILHYCGRSISHLVYFKKQE
jgi:hypothetical protein